MKTREFLSVAALMAVATLATLGKGALGYEVAAIPVDAMVVKGLSEYKGKSLHVFYVSGRESAIGVNGAGLNVRSIKRAPVKVEINSAGEASIPSVDVDRTGFDIFNHLVMVVRRTTEEEAFLKNADDTYPVDARVPDGMWEPIPADAFEHEKTSILSMIKLGQLKAAQGSSQKPVEVNF
jgi:hypothetical protein